MAVNTTMEDEKLSEVPKRETLARLFGYLLAYKVQISAVLVIMLVSVGITLLNPLLMQRAIDVHIAGKDWDGLWRLGAAAVLLNICLVLLVKARMYIMAKVSNQVLLVIREELYTHIQTLGFHFFDSRPAGKILARIIGDINSLKDVLSNSVTTLIPDFITIVGVAGIMFAKNWRLAAAALSSLPLMIVGIAVVQTKTHVRWQEHRKKGSNMNAFVHEDISGMYIVQSFGAEEETRETFEELLKEHRDSFVSAVRYADAFGPVVDLCWGIGTMMLYLVGANLILDGKLQVGTLIAFGSYISMFWRPVMNLSNFYNQLVTNIAGAERIFEILDTKPEITDGRGVEELPDIRGDVSFSHVTFAYEDDRTVLGDVSFEVRAGETVALIGPTGAGKSTIVNLICRFYDIQTGSVQIDGRDVREVGIDSLRRQMGIMTQDVFLFSGTVRDNIRYGRLDADDEEIVEAAKAVHAHEFIQKLEHGYDTKLKERGAGLSAGQRQLLAFARTMLAKPKILILDEATSSIDTRTELLVQQGIEELLRGRTSFVIAHRLSTIQNADRIFRVEGGAVTELAGFSEIREPGQDIGIEEATEEEQKK